MFPFRPTLSRSLLLLLSVLALAVVGLAIPSPAAAGPAWRPWNGPSCGTTIYKADGSKWVCTFDDEFSGNGLDTSKWVYATTALTGLVNGSSTDYACYTNSLHNVSVANGYLNLTVRKESAPFNCTLPGGSTFSTSYSAGQVASMNKFSQTYGRFAVRAKFPAATIAGLHSALWMWPQNSGPSGEIDIAEWYSQYPTLVMPTLHYAFDQSTVNYTTDTNTNTTYSCSLADAAGAFHEYAVEWTSTKFTFSYDGQVCLTDYPSPTGTSPFDQPYFLALTQTLGAGTNALTSSTPLPATTQIDWVHAWK